MTGRRGAANTRSASLSRARCAPLALRYPNEATKPNGARRATFSAPEVVGHFK